MDVLQAIRERRSIRRFTAEPLDRAVVEEIVAQALWAPTSCNRQMWRFIIVDRETLHARLSKSAGYVAGIDPAVAVFVCCDPRYNPEHHAIVQGAAAGVQNMLLAAHSMGLGGLWMCGYGNEEAIKKELRIPEFYTILCAVAF
ncbi:MAG: nitroreductase family protein, partial [Armatimonadetes bacterium]|nr:nitroreductase family protein [Armatimonadota bacterium]